MQKHGKCDCHRSKKSHPRVSRNAGRGGPIGVPWAHGSLRPPIGPPSVPHRPPWDPLGRPPRVPRDPPRDTHGEPRPLGPPKINYFFSKIHVFFIPPPKKNKLIIYQYIYLYIYIYIDIYIYIYIYAKTWKMRFLLECIV